MQTADNDPMICHVYTYAETSQNVDLTLDNLIITENDAIKIEVDLNEFVDL